MHVQSVYIYIYIYICGLTQQVRIDRENSFLLLDPGVISLTSIRLTTGRISQSYLGSPARLVQSSNLSMGVAIGIIVL